jgi:3-methyladenine DNA glycosylase AlkD
MNNLINDLKVLGSLQKAEHCKRFFKTGVGEYGHRDVFWGITVPVMRKVANNYKHLDVDELEKLLEHQVHEVRFCALLLMVSNAKKFPDKMYDLYLKKTAFINNWDLVDLSAPAIVGNFLLGKDCSILYTLARSEALWEKRISIIATYAFIKQGQYEHTLKLAEILMNDKHDLIHKAVGWMLREVGERCSESVLEAFLEKHAATMPRTALRYAIEHFSDEKKKYFMKAKEKLVIKK